jgi:hypothetical protein
MVPLAANRFLEMMSQTAVSWLLLDGATIAERRLAELPADHPDVAFYAGKRAAAIWYARTVAPDVVTAAEVIASEIDAPLTIPDGGFATV